MYLLISFLGLAFIGSFWVGYKRMLRLSYLSQQRVINGFIAAMIVLTLITLAEGIGLVSEEISARFTMFLYITVAGFFCGFTGQMMKLRQEMKSTEYVYRSFWTDAAPNLIAVLLIAFGLYRTGLFTFGPYTGIGITSGISLFSFGLFGFTLRIVPEFRRKGILILDQYVPWKKVVSYHWESEEVLQIDYYTSENKITDFTTYIPQDDKLILEQFLGKKLKEHEQERKKMMGTAEIN